MCFSAVCTQYISAYNFVHLMKTLDQHYLIFRQFSSLCIYRYGFWRQLLAPAAEPVPLMGQKISGHTWSWPNLTMDALEKWFGPIKTKLYAIMYCVNTGKKTHIANLHYLLTIRYVTWVAQIIGHDVPSPKLPGFLGIGHIWWKFAQISA